jgi:hypothetical protein
MSESQLTASHLDMARSWLVRDGSVLFYGTPAAIDATTVNDLIHVVGGRRVLSCHGGHSDPDRPLGALIALFSSVDEHEAAALEPEERRLLAESIFRPASRDAPAPSSADLAPAVVSLLRELTRVQPLLVVLEAVHRLDRETRHVLQFVAERADKLPIITVAVEDVRGLANPEGYQLCAPPLVMIRLSPMPEMSLS